MHVVSPQDAVYTIFEGPMNAQLRTSRAGLYQEGSARLQLARRHAPFEVR
jgi:hypothetical protein